MKSTIRIIAALAFCAGLTSAYADVSSNSNATAVSGQTQGNAQQLTIENPPVPSNTQIKMAPAITAPNLTTTLTETCLGSVSGGVSILGGGVVAGSTIKDSRCGNRLDAREIKSWGDVEVAKEIMCGTDEVRAAYKRVGRPCIEDQNQKQADATPTTGKKIGTGTKDEYVRSSK